MASTQWVSGSFKIKGQVLRMPENIEHASRISHIQVKHGVGHADDLLAPWSCVVLYHSAPDTDNPMNEAFIELRRAIAYNTDTACATSAAFHDLEVDKLKGPQTDAKKRRKRSSSKSNSRPLQVTDVEDVWWALTVLSEPCGSHDARKLGSNTSVSITGVDEEDQRRKICTVTVKFSWPLILGKCCESSKDPERLRASLLLLDCLRIDGYVHDDTMRTLPEVYTRVSPPALFQENTKVTNPQPKFKFKQLTLMDLPDEILLSVCSHLFATSLRAFGCVNQRLRVLVQSMRTATIPQLALKPLGFQKKEGILGHQRASMQHMLRREAGLKCKPSTGADNLYEEILPYLDDHPDYVTVSVPDHTPPHLYVHRDTGIVHSTFPVLHLPRGGFLCDEPGLGKTVTVLSFLLWKAGVLPKNTGMSERCDASMFYSSMPLDERRKWCDGLILRTVRELQGHVLAYFNWEGNKYVKKAQEVADRVLVSKKHGLIGEIRRMRDFDSLEETEDMFHNYFNSMLTYHENRPNPDDVDKFVIDLLGKQGFARQVFMLHRKKLLQRRYQTPSERTPATLVVVPRHLVSHWQTQVMKHVGHAGDGSIVIERFRDSAPPVLERRSAFFDEDPKNPFPAPSDFVNKHWIVVTTFERLSRRKETQVLQNIHWMRLVIDEGDSIGGGSQTNFKLEANNIQADHKWIVSGTPTPIKGGDHSMTYLFNLLEFMKEPPFTTTALWKSRILDPFVLRGSVAAFWNLQRVLSRSMILHQKSKLLDILPPIVVEKKLIELSEMERYTYNASAGLILCNVTLTLLCAGENEKKAAKQPDQKEDEEDWADGWGGSWLNPENYTITNYEGKQDGAKYAFLKLRNACSTANKARIYVDSRDAEATVTMLVRHEQASAANVAKVKQWLHELEFDGVKNQCEHCKLHGGALLVTLCGHLICPECLLNVAGGLKGIRNAPEIKCMVCNHLQNNGDLAELQPGFIVRFQPVPGYTADRKEWWNVEVDPEGHSKGMYILRQIEELEKIRNRSGVKFKAIVFSDFRQSLATICDKIIRRNIQRYDNVAVNTDGELLSAVSSPRRGGQAYAWQNTKGWRSVADYATPEKQSIRELELERFTSDPDCNVLLLGTKHTDGLDLSVATHVFIVDEIWDQAVWTQVVARAHRLGSRKPIVVQELIARGSVEEEMSRLKRTKDMLKLKHKERTIQMLQKVRFIYPKEGEGERQRNLPQPGQSRLPRIDEEEEGAGEEESDAVELEDSDESVMHHDDDEFENDSPESEFDFEPNSEEQKQSFAEPPKETIKPAQKSPEKEVEKSVPGNLLQEKLSQDKLEEKAQDKVQPIHAVPVNTKKRKRPCSFVLPGNPLHKQRTDPTPKCTYICDPSKPIDYPQCDGGRPTGNQNKGMQADHEVPRLKDIISELVPPGQQWQGDALQSTASEVQSQAVLPSPEHEMRDLFLD
eukprot:m.167450 g.167450  ORF g.167450 m.167450 type:complete len:1446 (-) comp15305_c1_seq10:139-4476(-)